MRRIFRGVMKWVAANTEEGREALKTKDPTIGVYDPEAAPKRDYKIWYEREGHVNCMAYALDWKADYLHPGGVKPNSQSEIAEAFQRQVALPVNFKKAVCEGLEADGLLPVTESLYKPGHYLTALFVNSRREDYHFMRMDSNGSWSQMNFGTPGMSFKDFSGEPITNPAKANMGPDITFVGFYHVPKGGAATLRRKDDLAGPPAPLPGPKNPPKPF